MSDAQEQLARWLPCPREAVLCLAASQAAVLLQFIHKIALRFDQEPQPFVLGMLVIALTVRLRGSILWGRLG